jgi:hypothetical protein
MNWKALNKQQQQRIILIAIVAVAAIFGIKQFVIGPLLAGHAARVEEYNTLKDKVEKADELIKRDDEIAKRLAESDGRMRKAATDLIPSPENALAWATKTIYTYARSLGLDIESVADLEMDGGLFTAKEQEKRVFKPYGVRVTTQCTYEESVRFVETLEKENPYLTVSGIMIGAQLNTPERHQVMLTLEWPNWKDAKKSLSFRTGGSHDPS